MCAEIAAATAAPPLTARLPPSQKSFCTSTTTRARVMPPPRSRAHRLQRRLPPGECPRLLRQCLPDPLVERARLGQRLARGQLPAQLAAAHEGHDQVPVAV